MHRMHHEIEVTTRKVELEKRKLTKLNEDLKHAQGEYEDKVMPPKKKDRPQRNRATVVPIKVTESRLEKALGVLNVTNHENLSFRAQIDQYRRERTQMNQVFKKLHDELRSNSRQISNIVEESFSTREQLLDAKRRMSAIKKQVEQERKLFKSDIRELQKTRRQQEKEGKEYEVRVKKDLNGGKDYLVAEEESNFSEENTMHRVLKLAFLNTIQRRHIKQHQKNIAVFEQAFATIKSSTGISDIEEIVKIFVVLEEKNYSYLTYVNQQNCDIEDLEQRVRDLDDQFTNHKTQELNARFQRSNALQHLEAQMTKTCETTTENERHVEKLEHIISLCSPVVYKLAEMIKKEGRGYGNPPDPHEESLMVYLTWVEKSLGQWRELLPDANLRHGVSKPFPYTVGHHVKQLAPKRTQQVQLSKTELPVAAITEQTKKVEDRDSDSSDEDSGDQPWSRHQLKEKCLTSLARKKRTKKTAELEKEGEPMLHLENDLLHQVAISDLPTMEDSKSEASVVESPSERARPGVSDNEINEIFLFRYKMSKEDLQAMADRMGIQLNNLCYLKQEFDAYDQDRSGYIDKNELQGLLAKLGEELTEEELAAAFKELDSDGNDEIEFFEFVEWFTSDD